MFKILKKIILIAIITPIAALVLLTILMQVPPFMEHIYDPIAKKINTRHWTEEVRLMDERVITIERTELPLNFSSFGSSSWSEILEITVDIVSDNIENKPPTWNFEPFVPLVLDYDHEEEHWVMIASWLSWRLGQNLGAPDWEYKQWVSNGGAWKEVPLDKRYKWQNANLIVTTGVIEKHSHITIDEKWDYLPSSRVIRKLQCIQPNPAGNARLSNIKNHLPEQTWTEEVLLDSGEVVTVRRRIYKDENTKLKTELTVLTGSQLPLPTVWRNKAIVPMILDYNEESGHWSLVASWFSGQYLIEPQEHDWLYKQWNFIDDQWQEVPLEVRFHKAYTNLMSFESNIKGASHITLERKEKRVSRLTPFDTYSCIKSTKSSVCESPHE